MSYRIGQFRRPQLNSYSIPINITLGDQPSTAVTSNDIIFHNINGELEGAVIENTKCYYIRFGVQQKQSSIQNFRLKIIKIEEEEIVREQLIEEF